MSEANANIFKAIDAERRGTTFQEVVSQLREMIHRDLRESAEMHRSIYRAIRDRDPEAARNAMRDHLMLAQKAQEEEEEID